MSSEKFHNTSITIKGLLGLIEAKDIAIPEIQRPFVWKNSQVRDLIDSLYKGYPTGYIILWKNPNVKLKDGTISSGKKVIIDGQQRITALMTAIAAQKVFNNEFKESRVKIAFNPFAALEYSNGDSEAEMFAVQTPAHIKSKNWIPDISEIFSTKCSPWTFIPKYIEENPEMSGNDLQQVLDQLKSVETTQIGVIELSEKLDIDVVMSVGKNTDIRCKKKIILTAAAAKNRISFNGFPSVKFFINPHYIRKTLILFCQHVFFSIRCKKLFQI